MISNILYLSDNLAKLRELPDNSIDAIVTDSPYGLGTPPDPLKVLPDWVTKGYHEIRGKGFMGRKWDAFVPQPILWKECFRVLKPGSYLLSFFGTRTYDWGTMAIRLAGFEIRDCIQWIYGSGFPKSKASLKPANEPICVAKKPGPSMPLNIDNARIETDWFTDPNLRINGKKPSQTVNCYGKDTRTESWHQSKGRYPSNVIFDEETARLVDEQSGISGGDKRVKKIGKSAKRKIYGEFSISDTPAYNDIGGASRFFYVAKASPSERAGSQHPTIKPVKLMRQLVRLYVPLGGICLDCHVGSGPTIEACILEGAHYIGIDNDPQSIKDTQKRIDKHKTLFTQPL